MSKYFEKRFFTQANEDQSFVVASVTPSVARAKEIKPGSLYLSIHDGDRNNLIIETDVVDERRLEKVATLNLLKSVIDESLRSFQEELDNSQEWEDRVAKLEADFWKKNLKEMMRESGKPKSNKEVIEN